MNPSTAKVLRALRRYKNRGITAQDFDIAFRLAPRVRDLREADYDIKTTMDNGIGRYHLIREPKNG